MRRIFLLLIISAFGFLLHAQRGNSITLLSELEQFNVDQLPVYRNNTKVLQESSYDRRGGNDDGFSGTHSFVRKNADGSLVLLDIDGPGVLQRIWTPTPTKDTFDFFIDQQPDPVLSICYADLFSGKQFPFVAPLCDQAVGGFYCYFPILFRKHLKVVCRGKKLQFHQFQYRLFDKTRKVESFTGVIDDTEKVNLERLKETWEHGTVLKVNKGKQSNLFVTLEPGASNTIFQLKRGGRVKGIELSSSLFTQEPDSTVYLRIYWDNEKLPAIDCPLSDFFGFAFGKPAMKSLLIGSKEDKLYCYLPMPFDRSARVELVSKGGSYPIPFNIVVYYSFEKRKPLTEGKFYVDRKKNWPAKGEMQLLLAAKGKGHYVGTVLIAEGDVKGETSFFEGDDSTAIDGEVRMHGTGSEDYFNGGWYNIKGRWDTIRCQPLSGCLGYSVKEARTGGYRFFLSDKLSFEKSIYHAMEHGPLNNTPAMYTTVAFYYRDKPKQQ